MENLNSLSLVHRHDGTFFYIKEIPFKRGLYKYIIDDWQTNKLGQPIIIYSHTKSTDAEGIHTYKANYLNSDSESYAMVTFFKKFQSEKLKDYLSHLQVGDWCINLRSYEDSDLQTELTTDKKEEKYNNLEIFYYETYQREPTLKCEANFIINKYSDGTNMYIGALSYDEIIFAGGEFANMNKNYYLYKNVKWTTLSLSDFEHNINGYGYDRTYYINENGAVQNSYVQNSQNVRPSVVLINQTKVEEDGDGTKSNPYVVIT